MNRQEERAAVILDRRTRALADRVDARDLAGETAKRSLIVVAVGASLLGLDIAAVAAVIPFEGCARMPMRDPVVLGVIGRGGRFYSVIGLGRLLASAAGEDSRPAAAPAHLLLLRGSAPHMALGVDRVLGRFDLTAAAEAGGRATFDLDGQWVGLFDPDTLRSRFAGA